MFGVIRVVNAKKQPLSIPPSQNDILLAPWPWPTMPQALYLEKKNRKRPLGLPFSWKPLNTQNGLQLAYVVGQIHPASC